MYYNKIDVVKLIQNSFFRDMYPLATNVKFIQQ